MTAQKTVLGLTIDMLHEKAFSHLQQNELQALYQLTAHMHDPLTLIEQQLLLTYWTYTDINRLSPALLYRCDIQLQQMGRRSLQPIRTVSY
jgi:hypothetical protein